MSDMFKGVITLVLFIDFIDHGPLKAKLGNGLIKGMRLI